MKKRGFKKVLHTFFKVFIIFMLVTAVLNLGIVGFLYFSHKSNLKKEKVYMTPPGVMVEVNGHQMHVLVEGDEDAEETLVFLHSCSVVDDSIALQPLFDNLTDYRLVYVDRSGVGFSEISGASRDIDTMLDETRKAVKETGVEGPYTLVAIGTGGIQAFHWANQYPEEVKSIIGITMNYPEQFADVTQDEYCGFFDYLLVQFCKIGGQRIVKSIYPTNDYMLYTEMQMKVRNALVSKGGYTTDMYNEDLDTVDNAALVAAEGVPEKVPMYIMYANPLMEPYVNEDKSVSETYNQSVEDNSDIDYIDLYNKDAREYFDGYDNITFEEISGPARLYTYCPKELAGKIAQYIEAKN